MIFASCCLALVLLLFLVCLIRRTYCLRFNSSISTRRDSSYPSTEQMITGFNDSQLGMSVPFNIRLPFEKPPTYDESQRRMMQELGIPPPDYPEITVTNATADVSNENDNQQQCITTVNLENTEVIIATCSSTQTLTSVQASTSTSTDSTRDNKALESSTVNQNGVSNCAFEPD